MTTYSYSDGNITLSGTGALDDLVFTDDTGGSFDFKAFSYIREGDDLYIYADNDSTIIIEDQFLNSTLAYETLTFDDQAIDLASSNLQVMVRTYNPNGIISGSHYFYNYPNGTVSDDIILAGDRDREYYDINLSAGDGNDTIYANYIARLFAGAGNDLIYGRAGTLYAGAGDDTIYLSAEISNSVDNDGSHGEAGDDIFYGSEIRDRVWGDQDDDTLYGYEGDDDLFGGSGNDTIYGGDGDDTISADNSDYGDSNSWITNTGDDEIHGGAGNDYIVVGNGLDIAYGDDGDDHLRVLVGHTNNTDYGWGDKIFYGGAGNDNLSDGRDDDYLDGGSGDDTISASHGGNNTLVGGSGDDFLHAAAGINETSTLNGGFGDDTLTFGGRNNHPKNRSYNGDHNLYGGSGDDTYRTADPGSNMAHQHLGVKTIYDEHGYDDALEIVEYGWAYPNNSVAWTIAKSGDDVVLNYFNSNNQQFTGQITIEDHFMAWHHIESIVFGDTTIELVERLTEFDDTYTASAATSYFGIDDNIVDALDGDDTVYAGIGGDIVYGRGGDDTLYGEDGDDYLFGEDGNDVLYGGDGNDTLDGGEGIDVFKGGAGDDTFIGGDGIDTADYDNLGNAVSVNLMIGTVTGEGTDT
ncbi:MAG: hypothetical protein KTR28_09530, partial [Micavibrio sp.]|nr:hypothetical protein [Micavibrio sp.]